jgi:hypothetical protein
VGSRSNITNKTSELAYIAGFLDGDGSLMLQIKKRSDCQRGWRFMATICFYQDSRHEKPLYWIKNRLGIGYISKRNDNITELRVNGYKQCDKILRSLYSFVRFKKPQLESLLIAIDILIRRPIEKLTRNDRRKLLSCIMTIQNYNYQSPHKKSVEQLKKIFDLTP